MKSVNLHSFGFDIYTFYRDGRIFDNRKERFIKMNSNRYYLRLADGKKVRRIQLKELYGIAFGEQFCVDEIADLPGEEWRPVVLDSPGKLADVSGYYVSNLGRVKSKKGYKAKILSTQNNNGYLQVTLGSTKTAFRNFFVHRLVATAFIPNGDKSKDTVDHIDGDRQNNKATNLQWLSRADNIRKGGVQKQKEERKKSLN